MTKDVAIAILKEMKPIQRRADDKSTTHILQTMALEMAIRALEQTKCSDRNLCESCVNSGCMFQSGIFRTRCDFYKEGNNKAVLDFIKYKRMYKQLLNKPVKSEEGEKDENTGI